MGKKIQSVDEAGNITYATRYNPDTQQVEVVNQDPTSQNFFLHGSNDAGKKFSEDELSAYDKALGGKSVQDYKNQWNSAYKQDIQGDNKDYDEKHRFQQDIAYDNLNRQYAEWKKQNDLNKKVQDQVDQQKNYADALQKQSDKFRQNEMPAYIANQTGAATDQAKRGLNDSRMQIKNASNQRGLLYSGLKGGADAEAGAKASTDLAGQIQGINQKAQDQANQKDYLAQKARTSADSAQTQADTLKMGQGQDSYALALQNMQNQNNWWSDLIGGLGKVGGAVAALI